MEKAENRQLKKVLSFWDVFFFSVGQIIGAGVIALTGVAIGMTGPGVIFAYICAAILVLITSVFIMMAGSAIPVTGAFYVWPARLVNGWIGTFVLMLSIMASVTLSLYGSAFGMYISPIFPVFSVNTWGVILITGFFVTNLFGVKSASSVQMVLVILLISALAIYVGFAVPEIRAENLRPMFPKGAGGFITASCLLTFATGGAVIVVAAGGEMKNPKRDIPLIVFFSTVAVAVLYTFVALASVGTVPWQEMVNQPLTVAGKTFLPGWAMMYFLVCGAGLAICTTLNTQFVQLPRNLLVGCWDNVLPSWLGKMSKNGTPYIILTLFFLVGIIPLLVGLDVETIARATTIAGVLPGFFVLWGITQLPKKFPEEYDKAFFKIGRRWIWPLFVVSIIIMAISVVFLSQNLSTPVLVAIALFTAFSMAYYPLRRSYLRRKGIDLDRLTMDPAIIKNAG
ncbi:MAG: amino acid permease [Proteobacteria bacterium]|nr:amino acid permease [Pseudomonadota bacterium]